MIAVSSFRPLGQNPEWDRNQLAAKRSWDEAFDEVFYFNVEEPQLGTGKTTFIPTLDHPPIVDMCRLCSIASRWACIINADIIVSPRVREIERRAEARGAYALTSFRYQLNNGRQQVIDNGLDWFAALPWVWLTAVDKCPGQLRIGHPTWDTWMIGLFNYAAGTRFYNVTNHQLIFHPRHEDRRHVCNVDGGLVGMPWFCGMPPQRL